MKKTIAALLATAGMTFGGSASAIVVGGIDFGNLGLTSHLETTTIAETLITGDGQTLLGYGQINTVNGDITYCAVDADCRLFFTFTYTSQNFTPTSAEFIDGTVNVYYDPNGANRNLLDFSSAANVAYIDSLDEWVQLTGHDNVSLTCDPSAELCAAGFLTGTAISFEGTGLLDANTDGTFGLASVASYLDGNGIVDAAGGLADIRINTSGDSEVLNPNDVCTFQQGQWCIQGSADIRGDTNLVPEPGSLSLLGLALAGLGFGARRFRRRT